MSAIVAIALFFFLVCLNCGFLLLLLLLVRLSVVGGNLVVWIRRTRKTVSLFFPVKQVTDCCCFCYSFLLYFSWFFFFLDLVPLFIHVERAQTRYRVGACRSVHEARPRQPVPGVVLRATRVWFAGLWIRRQRLQVSRESPHNPIYPHFFMLPVIKDKQHRSCIANGELNGTDVTM